MRNQGLSAVLLALSLAGCDEASSSDDAGTSTAPDTGSTPAETDAWSAPPVDAAVDAAWPRTDPTTGPAAGNPEGSCPIPAEAQPADVSSPRTVVGTGTPESCTSAAFVAAVAAGGVITFDCGPSPVTIVLTETARIFNDTGPDIVIDGGGLVTLSGNHERRILYMNTCDEAQHWTTSHCQDQDHPRLTIQNLTFIDADSRGEEEFDGGGAIWVRGASACSCPSPTRRSRTPGAAAGTRR